MFQSPLDIKRLWASVHAFFEGREFKRMLALADSEMRTNRMSVCVGELLPEVPLASRRVVIRFHYCLQQQILRIFTENAISGSFIAAGVWPFNQQTMLDHCPAYRDPNLFDEMRKIEMAGRFPSLIALAMPSGYPSDDQIFEVMGDLVGPPQRGGVAAEASGAPGPIEAEPMVYHASTCLSHGASSSISVRSPCDCGSGERAAQRKRATTATKPLQELALWRWRAIYMTQRTIREAQILQAGLRAAKVLEKRRMQEERAKKAADKESLKVARAATRAEKLLAGPVRKINKPRPGRWECANPLCCTLYVECATGVSPWLGCDYCERWFCEKPECKATLEAHTKVCRHISIGEHANE